MLKATYGLYCSKITRTKYIALICFHTVLVILSDSLAQLASSANRPNLPTSLLYDLHWLPISSRVQYKIYSSHLLPHCLWCSSSISELLHLYTLLLALFTQPRILGSSVFLGWAGPWGRDSFSLSDLWSGTLFLSLLGILFRSLLSKNRKPTSSLLHTDLSFSFSFYQPQPITSNVRRCNVCVCVCVCLSVCLSVCLCVIKWAYWRYYAINHGVLKAILGPLSSVVISTGKWLLFLPSLPPSLFSFSMQ